MLRGLGTPELLQQVSKCSLAAPFSCFPFPFVYAGCPLALVALLVSRCYVLIVSSSGTDVAQPEHSARNGEISNEST